MAAVTIPLTTFNASEEIFELTYDDVSLLVTTLTFINNGSSGHLTVTITDPATQQNVFNTPATFAAKTGTTTRNVSGAGVHMVQHTDFKGNVDFGLPFEITCQWSPV